MNRKIGMAASALTLIAVVGFALSMIFGSTFWSYVSSMFIAWGFVPLICALASYSGSETKSAGYTAVAFATVYSVFIMVVYFAQVTTVRLTELSQPAAQLLDYTKFGLFFSYDLLGYGFMALATFFVALTIKTRTRGDKWLKGLMMVHGLFAFGILMPILGVFSPDMAGDAASDLMGVAILGFWCAYFTPVCLLSYLHFKQRDV